MEDNSLEAWPTEFQKIVMRAFDLDPMNRDAFLLCDIQGFTIREAAFALEVTPDVLTNRLDRARRHMNKPADPEVELD
jgi:DNA-directed RNA polymerase specialized sigma24 family protein